MLHKYCLQNRNIFYSINSCLQLPFFFFFFNLYQGLTFLTLIKNPFFKKNLQFLTLISRYFLNFFYEKKKNCSHVKHYLQKIGPHSQYTYVGFYTIIYTIIYLYLYYYLYLLLFKGLPLFGFLIFIVVKSPYISMFK